MHSTQVLEPSNFFLSSYGFYIFKNLIGKWKWRGRIKDTYSVLSTVGVVGIIISMQFTKIVVIMNSENKGCTNMYIATLLMGLNGSNIHRAFVAENLKISLPLLITTKVCNKTISILFERRLHYLEYQQPISSFGCR